MAAPESPAAAKERKGMNHNRGRTRVLRWVALCGALSMLAGCVDFEDYAVGPLGAPWSISQTGSSSATIVHTTDHGNVLRLHGSSALGDFLVASLGFSSSAANIVSQVEVNPASGASFIFSLHGAGDSIGRRRIRLQRAPGATVLVANTVPSGDTTCGTLPSGVWSTVTLMVQSAALPHTFDVLINGTATACRGVETGLSPPFSAVSVMDASNDGYGGDVLFDNIGLAAP
jgi:hypothetical protein